MPRYDETGNLYNYMVLEEDNAIYNSEYIYGEQVDGKFVYGHDVDGDNIREKNMLEKLLAENTAPWKKWEREVPIVK